MFLAKLIEENIFGEPDHRSISKAALRHVASIRTCQLSRPKQLFADRINSISGTSRSLNFIKIEDLATPRSRRRKFYESLDLSPEDKPQLPKYTPMRSARMVESSNPLYKSIKAKTKQDRLIIPRKVDEQRLIELAQPKSDHRAATPPNLPNGNHVFVSEKIIELAKPKTKARGSDRQPCSFEK
ncbi:Oidioi.mRNA.OKI2018_I69.chr2.g7893.t1.cds [Oikopleura dioica]|uniref:Oidioi.mRNA.OKI2018_I69.chr2.g7893.t1.cds n=1 Tax=Oikopleura dioica TaxID=34765 RepID=A0ABN7TDZ1_OIKDI|nr:Oidioi.mRNA.OKI2018_I69.chr2.g7893.t1.cds [Oikopleura dioica]